jgi:hypothetical protein
MSITVNGYEVNEFRDPAPWAAKETANFTALLNMMPTKGTFLVDGSAVPTPHKHSCLYDELEAKQAEMFSTRFGISQNTIIGSRTVAPDTQLHLYLGSAGVVAAPAGCQLTIENNGDNNLTFLVPLNTQSSSVFFGCTAVSNTAGQLRYYHAGDAGGERFYFNTNGAFVVNTGLFEGFRITNDRKFVLKEVGGPTVPDSRVHIWNATAGTITAVANTVLTIENSTEATVSFLTPHVNYQGFNFGFVDGGTDDNDRGRLLYYCDSGFPQTEGFRFIVGTSLIATILPNGFVPYGTGTVHCNASNGGPTTTTAGALWLDTDAGGNGHLKCYANGGWRTVAVL